MVDIVNRPLLEPLSFSSLIGNTANQIQNTKHWFGRCLGDPPRQLNNLDLPNPLQRQLISRELFHYFSTTVDSSTTMKLKAPLPPVQKTNHKELLKVTTVTSHSFLSNVDVTNSRLFDTFSKNITIKAEPLRPANNFLNSSSNTASSWQKYWTSTHTQRRRKEAKDSQASFTRSKPDQSNSIKTYFVTIRDSSSHTTLDPSSSSEASSTVINHITPTKPSSPIVPDQTKVEDQFLLPALVPPREKSPPLMNSSKFIEERSPSFIESESTIINGENLEMNRLITKIYKLPLPSNKPRMSNKSNIKRKSRPKSVEKKPPIPSKVMERKEAIRSPSLPNPMNSKRKNPNPSNKSHRTLPKKQQQSLSTIISTTARSRYERARWEEPYTGIRFDPPTPPCSPSLFSWPQNSDRDSERIAMGDETVLTTIEIVKQKLKKYMALQEHGKVKEYLRKLHHLHLNSTLIQETRIDRLIRKLACNKTASYSSTARHLLKRWHHKKLLPKSNKTVSEEKSETNLVDTNEPNESQSVDENKKRRVLSLAQYLESKKHVLSSSSTSNSIQRRFTDNQIEVIHAQFQATTEKLTANASDLANSVNKNLIDVEKPHLLRNDSSNKRSIIEQPKSTVNDLWAEDDDEDGNDHTTQSQILQSRTTLHTQKVQ